jgi:hypothetical protein
MLAMSAVHRAAANLPLLAYDRPSPGGSGHLPQPVAADNTTDARRGDHFRITLHPSIQLVTGATTPVTIPVGKRWFGSMIYISAIGWMTIFSAPQR